MKIIRMVLPEHSGSDLLGEYWLCGLPFTVNPVRSHAMELEDEVAHKIVENIRERCWMVEAIDVKGVHRDYQE